MKPEPRMTFTEHLEDLRRRILYILAVFVVVFGVCLGLVSRIYGYLVGPLAREGYHLMVTSPGEVITVYLSIAGIVAVGLTLPFALYQLWKFVAPGLTPVERRYTLRLLPITLVMFILGVLFAWFVIFPTILHFLLRIAAEHFSVMLRAGSYFGFLTNICLPFGFIFELPIVVVFLTRIGVISPQLLRRVRRYAYLVIVILGVLISPPELISHLSVVVPMILLYEASIALSVIAKRRRDKAASAASLS
ncbi:twin-arginine translocase subunit TatC [Alicyclobacillus macrosporangiidus]|uniref:twin-arginine translocase subunit TatC n=1 Tax=Alicyclobacillus macrosporangiidus TaxID=392015 RepID=UPI00068CF68B|nr:twin-arginine translocase subunit TatC [Alicyclobacillus macrosporangiidus]